MKKMRKLLPAFAMLLVSAIMMSTASFAWFTMNESVTASGMSVQAKATGSLLIDDEPLRYDAKDPSVTLSSTQEESELKPITWGGDTLKWSTSTGTVDMYTGVSDSDTLASVLNIANVADQYFIDRDIYIASAGDALLGQSIRINLSSIATSVEDIWNAYAVAVYVVGAAVNTASYDQAPDAIVYLDSLNGRSQVILRGEQDGEPTTADGKTTTNYKGYDIPSIVGVTGETGVGLKIVLRFFVDGNLDAVNDNGTPKEKEVPAVGYKLVGADDKFVSGQAYFTKEDDGSYEEANISGIAPGDDIPNDWYVPFNTTALKEYKYVNTDNVPMTGTSIKVTFTAADVTPVVENAEEGNG